MSVLLRLFVNTFSSTTLCCSLLESSGTIDNTLLHILYFYFIVLSVSIKLQSDQCDSGVTVHLLPALLSLTLCVFSLFPHPVLWLQYHREGLRWSGWTGFQCWTTNISVPSAHCGAPQPIPLSARHKPRGQNTTAKTLVVIPPAGGTKSSSPITTLETWRCLPLGDRDSLLSTA